MCFSPQDRNATPSFQLTFGQVLGCPLAKRYCRNRHEQLACWQSQYIKEGKCFTEYNAPKKAKYVAKAVHTSCGGPCLSWYPSSWLCLSSVSRVAYLSPRAYRRPFGRRHVASFVACHCSCCCLQMQQRLLLPSLRPLLLLRPRLDMQRTNYLRCLRGYVRHRGRCCGQALRCYHVGLR